MRYKKTPQKGRLSKLIILLSLGLETVTTVNRSILAWLKWNLSRYPTIGADYLMQLPGPRTVILVFPAVPASFTTPWFICKTPTGIKLLFTGCENKFRTTIRTRQTFVLKFHDIASLRTRVMSSVLPLQDKTRKNQNLS